MSLIPSLLFCERAFPDVVDSLVLKMFLGATLQTPKLLCCHYENDMLNIFLLEENLTAKIYSCGGTYMKLDVPSVEALPPCPRYAQTPLLASSVIHVSLPSAIMASSCLV